MAENHQSDAVRPAQPLSGGHSHGPIAAWPQRLWNAVRVPCLLLLLVALAHWKLVLTNQYTWIDTPDIARQVVPWMQFQVGELQAGRLPLWDPYSWGGQPLLAQAQPGTANPVNWLLFAMPTRHGWIKLSVLHWYFVLIHWLCALFFYWFLRSLQCGRTAAVLGGLVYALSGFVNYVDWPQQKMGGLWAPLILLYAFRALRNDRYWRCLGLAGLFLGLSVLTGHHVAPMFVGLAVAGVWLWETWAARDEVRMRLAAGLLAMGVIAGMVGAVQILPAMEYSKLAVRWVGMDEPVSHDQPVSYTVHTNYGIQSFALIGTVLPGVHRHTNAYIGFVSILLALSAVWGLWGDSERGRAVRWLACLGVAGLLFSLAGETNFHGILYALIPMLEKARNPSHAVAVWSLGAAGLAGIGVDRLLRREGLEQARWLFSRVAVGSGLLLWAIWTFYFADKNGKVEADARGVVVGFLAFLAAALVSGWVAGALSRRGMVAGLAVLLMAELSNGMAYQYPNLDSPWRAGAMRDLPKDSELVGWLQGQPGLYRFEWNGKDHLYNISDLYGLETDMSFLASVTGNVYRLGIGSERAHILMGTKFVVAQEPHGAWNRLAFTARDGSKVWANDAVMPRVWTVHHVEGGWKRGQAAREMERGEHDFRRWAFLAGPAPKVESCPGSAEPGAQDHVYLLRRVSNLVEIHAEMACRGLLVLSDTWYPGWRATVDGHPAELLEVYGGLRGVVLDQGAHRVRMVFRPASVYLGAGLSLLGLLAAAGLYCTRNRMPAPGAIQSFSPPNASS
ncbi:MAG: hypothetical protein IT164_18575 [Bryobacterales bacterium]|nr:hypothetical protein [Bryobacterales bacterium]